MSTHFASAQCTVIATSGLSIRAKMDVTSEILSVEPFGSVVNVVTYHKDHKITVDDIEGFWIEVSKGNVKGFMFSGFLYPNELTFIDGENEEFLIIDEKWGEDEEIFSKNGDYHTLNYESFNPDRIWYGVNIQQDITTFEKVDLNLAINYQNNQKDQNGYLDELREPIFSIDPNTKKVFHFFIGTKQKLTNTEIQSMLLDKEKEIGTFLFPYQEMTLSNESSPINLKATVKLDSAKLLNYYELFVYKESYREKVKIALNNFEYLNPQEHVNFQAPRLIWSGDINEDGIPELIFLVSILRGICVPHWAEFYISQTGSDGQISYQKANSWLSLFSFTGGK